MNLQLKRPLTDDRKWANWELKKSKKRTMEQLDKRDVRSRYQLLEFVTGHDHYGLELKPFGEVHCADGYSPISVLHAV